MRFAACTCVIYLGRIYFLSSEQGVCFTSELLASLVLRPAVAFVTEVTARFLMRCLLGSVFVARFFCVPGCCSSALILVRLFWVLVGARTCVLKAVGLYSCCPLLRVPSLGSLFADGIGCYVVSCDMDGVRDICGPSCEFRLAGSRQQGPGLSGLATSS